MLTRLTDAARRHWSQARARNPWLDHVARAWSRFQANNGSQYAAAITYFSFLALFPMILLAVSVLGFVLHSHPHLQDQIFANITSNVPGPFGSTLKTAIDTAIKARTGVGAVGLVGVLLSGLGWIGNLRAAIDAVWGVQPPSRNFVVSRLANLLVLAGLGIGILISLGLSTVGVAVTDQIVRAIGIGQVSGIRYVIKAASVLLGVAGDVMIFGWLLVRLPGGAVSRSVALRGALLAAVGFEVLKFVGTYTIAKSAHSPTAGPFASIVAVLIWIQLVVRYLLFCAAWMAATGEPGVLEDEPVDAVEAGSESPVGPSPLRVGASIFGAGAVVGAAAASWAHRSGRRDHAFADQDGAVARTDG